MSHRRTRLAMIGYLCRMWELYAAWAWFLAFFTAALHRRGMDNPVLAANVKCAGVAVGGLAAGADAVPERRARCSDQPAADIARRHEQRHDPCAWMR